MSRDLVLDAKLARDVDEVRNSGSGDVQGLRRIHVVEYRQPTTIQSGSNFAAQAYARPDGTYTIAYRGTNNLFEQGDFIHNRDAILAGKWTPVMQQAVQFTFAALGQVQREKGFAFKEAAQPLPGPGHTQVSFAGGVMGMLQWLIRECKN